MSKYLIRKNCEYSLEVEAESEEEALKKAQWARHDEWGVSWSGLEAELVSREES